MDLVATIIHLDRRGEPGIYERFKRWLKDSENIPGSDFIVGDEKYCRKRISSAIFKDIIDEDSTDWMLIQSENKGFEAIGKIRPVYENLIGIKNEVIGDLWIIRSNIESIKIGEKPIEIRSPYAFDSRPQRIDYDYIQLLAKLKDPKIGLIQFVWHNAVQTETRRIR